MGTGALSQGVKRPGREDNHSPPTTYEVKKVDLYINFAIHLHGEVLNSLSTGTNLLKKYRLQLILNIVPKLHVSTRAP
jgi:hypothetical protein